MLDKKIGLKIKQIRKSWGLSQIELAERIGISFQQIQKYEKGSTRISVMRLQQISKALGVNITAFFEEGKRAPQVSDLALRYT
ncbi:MAG: helix-turn-helix transcriptional regulator, partial [Desulfobacterales bacterium]|nr:helix-turn-helix transcriptional regulator [Desulfobacterales bacterium]